MRYVLLVLFLLAGCGHLGPPRLETWSFAVVDEDADAAPDQTEADVNLSAGDLTLGVEFSQGLEAPWTLEGCTVAGWKGTTVALCWYCVFEPSPSCALVEAQPPDVRACPLE